MQELKDIEGRVINVGDRIAYPGRQGSSLWMSKATVLELGERPRWEGSDTMIPFVKVRRDASTEPRIYSWQGPERLIVDLTVLDRFVKL